MTRLNSFLFKWELSFLWSFVAGSLSIPSLKNISRRFPLKAENRTYLWRYFSFYAILSQFYPSTIQWPPSPTVFTMSSWCLFGSTPPHPINPRMLWKYAPRILIPYKTNQINLAVADLIWYDAGSPWCSFFVVLRNFGDFPYITLHYIS